jgi:hypothetical protein
MIQHLAEDLCELLLTRDPLADKVHHPKLRALALAGPRGGANVAEARA